MFTIRQFALFATVTVLSLGGLTACNTVEGVGEDVKAAGDALDDTAARNKPYR